VVFDSNRRRAPDAPLNTTELFLMDIDGANQRVLARGSSATWSPDGSRVAFHASASGRGQPIRRDPGAPATDSDLFLLNVRDALATGAQPTNLTNTPTEIEDDADWSPDGHRIVYTRHPVTDDPLNSSAAEIYVMLVDGSAEPLRLTTNGEEERAPSWSPDGHRIVYMCRHGGRDFEICVMNADGSGAVQLTDNAVGDLSPDWSPDGTKIVFHRTGPGRFQLWMMNADGSGQVQLTQPPGMNAMANWHAGPR